MILEKEKENLIAKHREYERKTTSQLSDIQMLMVEDASLLHLVESDLHVVEKNVLREDIVEIDHNVRKIKTDNYKKSAVRNTQETKLREIQQLLLGNPTNTTTYSSRLPPPKRYTAPEENRRRSLELGELGEREREREKNK